MTCEDVYHVFQRQPPFLVLLLPVTPDDVGPVLWTTAERGYDEMRPVVARLAGT